MYTLRMALKYSSSLLLHVTLCALQHVKSTAAHKQRLMASAPRQGAASCSPMLPVLCGPTAPRLHPSTTNTLAESRIGRANVIIHSFKDAISDIVELGCQAVGALCDDEIGWVTAPSCLLLHNLLQLWGMCRAYGTHIVCTALLWSSHALAPSPHAPHPPSAPHAPRARHSPHITSTPSIPTRPRSVIIVSFEFVADARRALLASEASVDFTVVGAPDSTADAAMATIAEGDSLGSLITVTQAPVAVEVSRYARV